MSVLNVVVVGPNLRDQSKGQFHVHAEGCADLKRDPLLRHEDQSYIFPAASVREVAEDVYADIIAENEDEDIDAYIDDFHFAPCCASLEGM
jgi:hypothetical protein